MNPVPQRRGFVVRKWRSLPGYGCCRVKVSEAELMQ
jgi:hypothetical protein